MTQVFRISKGMAVLGWILLSAMMGLFGWMGVFPHLDPEFEPGGAIFLTVFALVFEVLMVIALIDMVKSKLIIDEEKIISTGVFKTKTLALSEVKGYRIDRNYLYFMPVAEKARTYLTVAMLFLFGGMYAFGLISTSNVAFDQSEPTIYEARVLDKRFTTGKNSTYYLKLDTWGPQTEVEEVSVARDVYEMNEIGDTAVVYFNQGLYQIPYYLIIK